MTSRLWTLAILACCLWLPAAMAQRLPTLARGMPYAEAREVLRRDGWQPVTMPDADRCAPGDTRCEGRPEMMECAGTGLGECNFSWLRQGIAVVVSTTGTPPVIDGVRLLPR